MITADFYMDNRARLLENMEDDTFYFCHSGDEKEMGHDDVYHFEPYRNFLYLTGLDRPDCLLLLTKINGTENEVLFMHIPTPLEQRWQGITFNPKKIKEQTGIEQIRDISTFESYMTRILFSGYIQDAYMDYEKWNINYPDNTEMKLAKKLQTSYPYLHMHNAFATVASMRTIKTDAEIDMHRKAVAITEEGVRSMLVNMKPGMFEYQIEAYYNFVLNSHGVKVPAFPTIAASGLNACHMHYMSNDSKTKDGQLILFDLGARWNYYCADVSRTYPVNGKFTERQKQLYNVVLKGLKAAEEAARPGVVKDELQELSRQIMAQELIKIGKISKPDEISQYYFHGSGHTIGLDTHDAGDENLILQKNMMFTLEPGLYFDDEEIGIRIEDTLVVTDTGVDILSDHIPKEIDDIEAVMAKTDGN